MEERVCRRWKKCIHPSSPATARNSAPPRSPCTLAVYLPAAARQSSTTWRQYPTTEEALVDPYAQGRQRKCARLTHLIKSALVSVGGSLGLLRALKSDNKEQESELIITNKWPAVELCRASSLLFPFPLQQVNWSLSCYSESNRKSQFAAFIASRRTTRGCLFSSAPSLLRHHGRGKRCPSLGRRRTKPDPDRQAHRPETTLAHRRKRQGGILLR